MAFLSLEEFIDSPYFIALYCERMPQTDPVVEWSTHAGIIFKDTTGLKIFHYGWHNFLQVRNGIPKNKAVYIGLEGYDSKRDPDRIITDALIVYIKDVTERNYDRIPYGTVLSNLSKFTGGRELVIAEGSVGVTCSTFIMLFFKAFDLELIDMNSWKSRKFDDENWKQFILRLLEKTIDDREHIESVRAETIMFRFKPEEVIASGLIYPHGLKANFDYCEPQGNKIKTILEYVKV